MNLRGLLSSCPFLSSPLSFSLSISLSLCFSVRLVRSSSPLHSPFSSSPLPAVSLVLFPILRIVGQVKLNVKRDSVDVQINSDLSSCTNPDAFGAYHRRRGRYTRRSILVNMPRGSLKGEIRQVMPFGFLTSRCQFIESIR